MSDRRLHEHWDPPTTAESQSLLEQIAAIGKAENQAAASRLVAVGELFEQRRRQRGEEADWAVDTWAAVGAELSAALRISVGKAGSLMHYGQAMRRLPAVAAIFLAGDIDMPMFRTIAYRTDLITNDRILNHVDQTIALYSKHWPGMTVGRLAREVDAIIAAVDPDAVRRDAGRARDRDFTIRDDGHGVTDVFGRLLTTDAHVLDKRLEALAATVCEADPRNGGQRRADAMGALAAGADRLMCQCERPDCQATVATSSPVVIHVVAEEAALEGGSEKPGVLLGTGTLIPAQLLRDLAARARRFPLIAPVEAEPRYRPSKALADFVRARDMTCRAPGCDRPATHCDLDHTVAYADGGKTHCSNIKALCRLHHLLKTFWGWKDRQLPDGTVIWDLPDGQTYVTLPGSALLFPNLMTPTGTVPPPAPREPAQGERTAMMPLRKRTRTQNRTHRIATERSHNRRVREAAEAQAPWLPRPTETPSLIDDPPPF